MLKRSNAKIIRAKNGEEAVNLCIDNKEINLILMDIKMPVMDGKKATKQIKQIRPDLPIIAQTAYAFLDEKTDILTAGFDDYISKPILIPDFLQKIKKHLNL